MLSPDAIPKGSICHHKLPLLESIGSCAKKPEEKHGLISWGAISLLGEGQASSALPYLSVVCPARSLYCSIMCILSIIDPVGCNVTLAEENDDYAVKRGK